VGPEALDLFVTVMIALASIPGGLPPMMLDVEADSKCCQEMHVDGGIRAQVFAYQAVTRIKEVAATAGVTRERRLYVLRYARQDADWADVERNTMSIAARSVASLIHSQLLLVSAKAPPIQIPFARLEAILSRTRLPPGSLSNCANDSRMSRVSRPIDVVVLNDCDTETKVTFCASNNSTKATTRASTSVMPYLPWGSKHCHERAVRSGIQALSGVPASAEHRAPVSWRWRAEEGWRVFRRPRRDSCARPFHVVEENLLHIGFALWATSGP